MMMWGWGAGCLLMKDGWDRGCSATCPRCCLRSSLSDAVGAPRCQQWSNSAELKKVTYDCAWAVCAEIGEDVAEVAPANPPAGSPSKSGSSMLLLRRLALAMLAAASPPASPVKGDAALLATISAVAVTGSPRSGLLTAGSPTPSPGKAPACPLPAPALPFLAAQNPCKELLLDLFPLAY